MQLEFRITDTVEKTLNFFSEGGVRCNPDHYGKCDICDGSTVAITFNLRSGAPRGEYPNNPLGRVTLCLDCVEDIHQLYEENQYAWNKRWNDTLNNLRLFKKGFETL